MSEGRAKVNWSLVSNLMALLANQQRDPKKRPKPFTPSDFDPFAKAKPKPVERLESLKGLKSSFMQFKKR